VNNTVYTMSVNFAHRAIIMTELATFVAIIMTELATFVAIITAIIAAIIAVDATKLVDAAATKRAAEAAAVAIAAAIAIATAEAVKATAFAAAIAAIIAAMFAAGRTTELVIIALAYSACAKYAAAHQAAVFRHSN
jgi:hypothetical protein